MNINSNMKMLNVYKVATHRLCLGCGACFYICPNEKVKLVDIDDDGIRPIVSPGGCDGCDICVKVCPGLKTELPAANSTGVIQQLEKRWGNIIERTEGYAVDTENRFKVSSGGLFKAMSLLCI